MRPPGADFEELVVALLLRFLRQNGATPEARSVRDVATRAAALVAEHGLPLPVRSEHESDAGRLPEAEYTRRAEAIAGAEASPLLVEAARQLAKALWYPELSECRGTFEAVSADGSCRRQELERVRRRLSGTHCVDCPHWCGFSAEEHRAYLAPRWRAGAEALHAHVDVFVPEEFRALRRWIAQARGPR